MSYTETGDPDIDRLRDAEYRHMQHGAYLDHAGTAIYAKSVIDLFSADLQMHLYGNPHSGSAPSSMSTKRVDKARLRALEFFHADPDIYDLIFVANATAAIKLAGECVRDAAEAQQRSLWYGYHYDSHTSMVGIRELVQHSYCFTSDSDVEAWIDAPQADAGRVELFAFPGQSNMTGKRLPLSWCNRIRNHSKRNAFSLLDAAALASTSPLDLSCAQSGPDFVALSFYKIFGFPDLGALLVRKASTQQIWKHRRYFGGGSVDMVVAVDDTWHVKKSSAMHDQLEDGTLPFHSIIALDHALSVHYRMYGMNPMGFISAHTTAPIAYLYHELQLLKHANGRQICYVYKDARSTFGNPHTQGATLAFNIQRAEGGFVGYKTVEAAANKNGVYLRSGSLCNPGGMAAHLNWSSLFLTIAMGKGHSCSTPKESVMGRATGVLRVSLGAMSTKHDLQRLLEFIRSTYGSSGRLEIIQELQQ